MYCDQLHARRRSAGQTADWLSYFLTAYERPDSIIHSPYSLSSVSKGETGRLEERPKNIPGNILRYLRRWFGKVH